MFNLMRLITEVPEFRRRWLLCFCGLILYKVVCFLTIWAIWGMQTVDTDPPAWLDFIVVKGFVCLAILSVFPEILFWCFTAPYGLPQEIILLFLCFMVITLFEALLFAYLVHIGDELLFRYRSRKAAR